MLWSIQLFKIKKHILERFFFFFLKKFFLKVGITIFKVKKEEVFLKLFIKYINVLSTII
jgi:hypothetical protein